MIDFIREMTARGEGASRCLVRRGGDHFVVSTIRAGGGIETVAFPTDATGTTSTQAHTSWLGGRGVTREMMIQSLAAGAVPPKGPRIDLGFAGHFCASDSCRFIRHTHVAKWCISTVGDCHFAREPDVQAAIGCNRTHETMVFVSEGYTEIDYAPYNTDDDAAAGHEAMVERYLAMARGLEAES